MFSLIIKNKDWKFIHSFMFHDSICTDHSLAAVFVILKIEHKIAYLTTLASNLSIRL